MGRKRTSLPIGEDYARFGEILKGLRLSKGLTQDELSREIGVGKTTIVNYETGTRKVPLDLIIAFSEFFGVTVDSLIGVNFKGYNEEPKIMTTDPYVRMVVNRWKIEIGHTIFNDDELTEIINFAKFVKSKRGEENG